MSSDKRQHVRRSLGYAGWIIISNSDAQSLIECTIEDASTGGARLTLRSALDLPERFDLRLTKSAQAAKHCRVVWREGNAVGVEFLAESKMSTHL
jgi:hypothetical protein